MQGYRAILKMLAATAASAVVSGTLPGAAWAQVYAGHDASGDVVLAGFRSDQARELVVSDPASREPGAPRAANRPAPAANSRAPKAIRKLLEEAARRYRLDPRLLDAVIRVESGYNPVALSAQGARGLMQLMPATASRFGVTDSFDPKQNVYGGARYLRWLLELFENDLELALAAYNAGEQAVIRARYRVPEFAETRRYVQKVLEAYRTSSAR